MPLLHFTLSQNNSMPDTMPASAPDKLLGARVFPQNCIGNQGAVADIDAVFDNVMVATSARED
jgi:hypothetical protein